jgi:hypothetical protein
MFKRYGDAAIKFPDDGSRIKMAGHDNLFTDNSELSEQDIINLRSDLNLWVHQNKLRKIENVMKSNSHQIFTMYGVKDMTRGWAGYVENIVYKHINGKYYLLGSGSPMEPESFNSVYYGMDIHKLTKIPTRNLYSQISRFFETTPASKYCKRKVNANQIKLCILLFKYNKTQYCELAADLGDSKLYTYNKKSKIWEYLFADKDDLTLNCIEVCPLKQTLTKKQFSCA